MAETCTHHLPPFNKQRKRKRLSQVVDKLTTQVVKSSPPPTPPPSAALLNNNFQHNKNHNLEPMLDHMIEPAETSPPVKSEVFRFDSVDRERYTYAAISEEEDVFSPRSSTASSPHVGSCDKLPFSPRDSSPFSPGDSPKVPFSPMCIKDGEEVKHGPSQPRYPGCACAHCSPLEVTPMDRYFPGGVPPSPVSPLTPCTPSPINNFEHYLHSKYLPDIFRRRSHSDSDIPMWFEGAALSIKSEIGGGKGVVKNEGGSKGTRQKVPLTLPTKGGSLESENSTPQDSPLDLSVRGSRGSSTSSVESLSRLRAPPKTPPTPPHPHQDVTTSYLPRSLVPVPVVRGDVASPTTKESVAHRYNLEVSPVVEEMPPGSDVAYVCPVCGQMFSLHDRLAKHMASRHKTKQQADLTAKAYLCDVCQRSFARSDMLTRHMRLHTGIKPYTCRVCGQVFSRSDHLSTHQRTHTGEKPYRCPQCPYAACRRDMITRHMRTHARYEAGSIAGSVDDGSGGGSDSPRGMISPPPLSPSQALSSLSVHSPSPSSPPEPMDND